MVSQVSALAGADRTYKDLGDGVFIQLVSVVGMDAFAATSQPVSGTLSASGNSGEFTPQLARPIWVTLSGSWAGSVQLKRSINGGSTWQAITTGSGTVKGVWTGSVNAQITEETCSRAIYRLEATLTSGALTYEVYQ
ncbi:hypothetical protein GTZ99_12540 [Novosphingobium sp. FSY-8]|uniref:Uncharacterized protein n=1 Tax=Novosphingobium ovatum TaxID=1908523 RepID=A0ABW9XFQ4_9SPHN|nr:hypothetical protein [Novosphingobium ovatum]NBC37379.1 hypothetical protein [Novosphingobium ovatum]